MVFDGSHVVGQTSPPCSLCPRLPPTPRFLDELPVPMPLFCGSGSRSEAARFPKCGETPFGGSVWGPDIAPILVPKSEADSAQDQPVMPLLGRRSGHSARRQLPLMTAIGTCHGEAPPKMTLRRSSQRRKRRGRRRRPRRQRRRTPTALSLRRGRGDAQTYPWFFPICYVVDDGAT